MLLVDNYIRLSEKIWKKLLTCICCKLITKNSINYSLRCTTPFHWCEFTILHQIPIILRLYPRSEWHYFWCEPFVRALEPMNMHVCSFSAHIKHKIVSCINMSKEITLEYDVNQPFHITEMMSCFSVSNNIFLII